MMMRTTLLPQRAIRHFVGYAAIFGAVFFLISSPIFAADNERPNLPPEFSETAKKSYADKMKTLRAAMDDQKWTRALDISEELNAMRPREPQARFIRSVALSRLNRTEEAKNVLIALVTDYPELPEPHNNLATIYAKAGNYALAREELERAIAVAPEYTVAQANLADLYIRLAAEHYKTALDQTKDAREKKALSAKRDALLPLMTP
jgi:tetratricopeptide (TPR) repeat protein